MEFQRLRCQRHNWQPNLADLVLMVSIAGLVTSAFGADNDNNASSDTPDLELLEFLGQFETDDGQWIDLDSLLSEDFTTLLQAAELPPATDNTNDPDDNQ